MNNVISLPVRAQTSSLSAQQIPCSILPAAEAFLHRAYPVASWVRHSVFGDGEVMAIHGHERQVRFESITSKDVADLSPEEIPYDTDPETLLNVAWIALDVQTVPVHELKLLQRKAVPSHQRWAY